MESGLDKSSGPVKTRVKFDSLLVEERLRFSERCLQRFRRFHGIGAILTGHGQKDAGPSLDPGITEFGFRTFDEAGQVTKPDTETVRVCDDDVTQRLWSEGLALGLQRDPLIAGFNKARSDNSRRKPCCGQHV